MINLSTIKNQLAISGSILDFPEFDELKNNFENNAWHHETTFEHTKDVLVEYENFVTDCALPKTEGHRKTAYLLNEKAGNKHKAQLFDLVIIFHDLGKASTKLMDGEITKFPQHEQKSYEIAKEVIKRFDLNQEEIDYVLKLVKYHGLPHQAFDNELGVKAGFLEIKSTHPDVYSDLLLLGMLDTKGSKLKSNNPAEYERRMIAYNEALEFGK